MKTINLNSILFSFFSAAYTILTYKWARTKLEGLKDEGKKVIC